MSLGPDGMFPVAYHGSEMYFKKFLNALIGRKGIEAALSKLDRLTREEVDMAIAEIRKDAHHLNRGVNQLIEGTFSTLATQKCHPKPATTRWTGNPNSYGRNEPLVAL